MNPTRTVLVTGSSSGFGREAVRLFAARGWRVIATMRRPEGRVSAAVLAALPGVTVAPLDVTVAAEREAMARLIDEIAPAGLDCLVANAGHGALGPLELLSEAQVIRQIDTNLTGHMLTIRALLPQLRRAKGRIIQLSSVLGQVAIPHFAAYVASKHAVTGLGEALRYELAPHGVQVCTLEPGRYGTDFNASLDLATVPAESPYRAGFKAALAPRRPDRAGRARRGGDPAEVARLIVTLAEARRMPVRRSVGTDAIALRIARRLVPEPLWDRIMLAAFADRRRRRGRAA